MKERTVIGSLHWLPGLVLMFVLMLGMSTGASAESISYLDGQWDDYQKKVVYNTRSANCTRLDEDTDEDLDESWYYVSGNNIYDDDKLEVEAGTVNIILCDGSYIKLEDGIYVPSGHTLNIYSQSHGSNMGKMDAIADKNCTAGIGGKEGEACGTINIYGGKIYARGDDNWDSSGEGGAGIGGGDEVSGGTIRIYGGDINAQGATDAAGIGGGDGGGGGNITIYGGTINAEGGSADRDGGAGIGGGDNGSGDSITIYGGTVKGVGGPDGAGIGGGDDGSGGNITIHGGSVTAVGGKDSAGIGGGDNASAGNITINGGDIDGTGGYNGTGIGGGDEGTAGNIVIKGGSITANAGCNGAGIGSGDCGGGGNITIHGGTINAKSPEDGAGIGGGNDSVMSKIEITGGTIKATGGEYGAGIGSGDRDSETPGGRITISGGNIEASGGKDGAGIGGGEDVTGGIINISGGIIKAYGGTNGSTGGAGIGGGDDADGGTVTITGGTIKEVRGGYCGAGIGGGDKGSGGTITITDGTINAFGGYEASGIGGGFRGQVGQRFNDGGTITIKGGTINVSGGEGGAGIGGGYMGQSGKIRIEGGTVTSNGGKDGGAGIGSGQWCKWHLGNVDVEISGGNVTATGGSGGLKKSLSDVDHIQMDGAGIGAGGLLLMDRKDGGDNYAGGGNESLFRGTIRFTGGQVTASSLGTTHDLGLKDSQGKVLFDGGKINVHSTPVRAKTITFADNMRVNNVLATEREETCRAGGGSVTIEPCLGHENRWYTDNGDGKTHSWECLSCMNSEKHEEEHEYGKPQWMWEYIENGKRTITRFYCKQCGHREEVKKYVDAMPPQVSQKALFNKKAAGQADDENEYIAEVTFNGKTYTDRENQQEYKIDTSCENGKIEVPDSANVGDKVALTITPDPHYHIGNVFINGMLIEEQDGNYSFTMPKGDVTVSADFEADLVKVAWVSRDYEYDYEHDKYTDKIVDTVVYTEEVPYGTEDELPEAGIFTTLYGKCGLEGWNISSEGNSGILQPGDKVFVDGDMTITAIWREHDFKYSAEGDTIKATCSAHENCSLPDGEIAISIEKPSLGTYGDTKKGYNANATLTLAGLDAFEEYATELGAFEEYAEELEKYLAELDIDEEDVQAWEKELEAWINKYMHYYKATKTDEGVYTKTGDALPAAPTNAGDYVAEFAVPDVNSAGGDLTASIGYTIEKADPSYNIPRNLTTEFGNTLGEVEFTQPRNGTWTWNEPDRSVVRESNFKAMATFTPNDTENYNIIRDIRIPVEVEITTEGNVADKALKDAAKAAVEEASKNPTQASVQAAREALDSLSPGAREMYGKELKEAQAAVEAAQKAVEKAAADKKAAEEKTAKELEAAKKAAAGAFEAAGSVKSDPAVAKAITALNTAAAGNDAAAIKAATDALNKAVAAAKGQAAAKKDPAVKIRTAKKSLKASKLKKKAQTFKIKYSKAAGSGSVTFKKTGGSKKITVSKAGKVKVRKRTKKGTYKLKVQLKVAAKGDFAAKTVKKTIKVAVK